MKYIERQADDSLGIIINKIIKFVCYQFLESPRFIREARRNLMVDGWRSSLCLRVCISLMIKLNLSATEGKSLLPGEFAKINMLNY